ncbi:MAG: hypothetical protein KBF12_10980 [Sebaldella sp.]|nr:hypothetical protein [Sebaldella sp.]
MVVYLLTHTYPVGKDKFFDEVRIIGVYSSKKKGEEALLEYQYKEGFKSHIDGFYLEKWEVDNDFEWSEGFITVMS